MIFSYLELYLLDRDSYYSDAESYYNNSAFYPHENADGYLYVLYLFYTRQIFGYAGAKFILLIAYLILGLKLIIKRSNTILLSLFFFHPFILFLFIRGMKESLMAVIFLIFITGFKRFEMLSISLLAVGFYLTRPFGHLMVIIPYLISLFLARYKNYSFWFAGSLALCASAPLIREILSNNIPYLLGMINVQADSGYTIEYSQVLGTGLIKFLLGPTPIRPLLALFYPIYEFFTPLTFFLLFYGSCVSIIIVLRLFERGKKLNRFSLFSLLLASGHALTYILIQDGMVDTRQRALYFLFLTGIFFHDKAHNSI